MQLGLFGGAAVAPILFGTLTTALSLRGTIFVASACAGAIAVVTGSGRRQGNPGPPTVHP